jgi:hypothetical protein
LAIKSRPQPLSQVFGLKTCFLFTSSCMETKIQERMTHASVFRSADEINSPHGVWHASPCVFSTAQNNERYASSRQKWVDYAGARFSAIKRMISVAFNCQHLKLVSQMTLFSLILKFPFPIEMLRLKFKMNLIKYIRRYGGESSIRTDSTPSLRN